MPVPRSIWFSLENPEPKVDDLVALLRGVQETFFAIGRYVGRTSPVGRRADKVKRECFLVLRSISMTSPVEVEVSVPSIERQVHFGPEGEIVPEIMLGDQCTEVFLNVTDAFANDGDSARNSLRGIIETARHRLEIARRYEKMIPDTGILGISPEKKDKIVRFDKQKKEIIFGIVAKEEEELVSTKEDVRTVIGPVIEARIVDKRRFIIGEIECKFKEDDVPAVTELFGRVATLTGKAMIQDGRILKFTELMDVSPVEEWRFTEIEVNHKRIQLSKAIMAGVTFEEDAVWIRDKLDLGIIGVGKTWTEALEDFYSEFIITLEGYAPLPDSRLSDQAIALREKLRNLVPHWKEVLDNVSHIQ